MLSKWLEWFDERLERGERLVASSLYLLLIAAIAANILARNLFHLASPVFLESAPVFVLWLALVGATLGLRYQRHIKIGLLMHLLPAGWHRAISALTSMCAILITAVLFYSAIGFVHNEITLFGVWGWRSVCFPLFFLIVFFRSVLRFWRQWQPAVSKVT